MIEASLKESYSVGVDRKVLLGVDVETVHGQLVRFLTNQELKQKYEDARSHGKQQCFIPPYIAQPLSKSAINVLHTENAEIMEVLVKVQSGLYVHSKKTWVKLDGSLFLNVDSESTLVHVRNYWYSKKDGCLKPHKRGVTITVEEAINTMLNISTVHSKLKDLPEV